MTVAGAAAAPLMETPTVAPASIRPEMVWVVSVVVAVTGLRTTAGAMVSRIMVAGGSVVVFPVASEAAAVKVLAPSRRLSM